ncbi:MAG: hypothetical protein KGM98_06640, partial [Bacteroidota bacterium]|nr:hypothetical protein [Bacteroidota bacterium]
QRFQIIHWYPKPAVYDRDGWHPLTCLEQGNSFGEFGSFKVQITLPKEYAVVATGHLENPQENQWLLDSSGRQGGTVSKPVTSKRNRKFLYHPTHSPSIQGFRKPAPARIPAAVKTLSYTQDSISDFVWFATKGLRAITDSLRLPSGRIIQAWSLFPENSRADGEKSLAYLKEAVRNWSHLLGDYPYGVISVLPVYTGPDIEAEPYPMIVGIPRWKKGTELKKLISNQVGRIWNSEIISPDTRIHPWMEEGLPAYWDQVSLLGKSPDSKNGNNSLLPNRMPASPVAMWYRMQTSSKLDQPIETPLEKVTQANYPAITKYKSGLWIRYIDNRLGAEKFDSSLRLYYQRWKFRHPGPGDFQNVMEEVGMTRMDSLFDLRFQKGVLGGKFKKITRIIPFFSFREPDKYRYLFFSPLAGYNYYDKFMIGGVIHNYTLPVPRFHFMLAPLYGTGSHTLNGLGRIGYSILRYGPVRKISFALSGSSFDMDGYTDSSGSTHYMRYSKLVPSVKVVFRNTDPLSSVRKFIVWKTFLIREGGLLLSIDTASVQPVIRYPTSGRYLNRLEGTIENERALYPYSATLRLDQAKDFVRLGLEGKYFFNYAKGGGMSLRVFAGKFLYMGQKTLTKEFLTDRYHLNMTGPNGAEDYTYDNYFAGRNEYQGVLSQQIMIGDGGFKVRSDLLASKIGKTDNWLAAANFSSSVPRAWDPLRVLPVKIPWKLFLDVGTYADAWQPNAPGGRFLYDAGIQVPLLKGLVNFYFPLLYSKVYRDYFKTTLSGPRLWKVMSFSIDIQNFKFHKFFHLPGLNTAPKEY